MRSRGQRTVGEGDKLSVGDFNRRRVIENRSNLRKSKEIELAAGRITNSSAKKQIIAEAVIPVPQPFGAVTVVRKAFHKLRFREVIGGGDKKRATLFRLDDVQRGGDRSGVTDGAPVIFGANPPHPLMRLH